MNVEELRDYCLSLQATKENAPWTEPQYAMLVTFTVGGKWFCLADLEQKFIDVKCAPERIPQLQERYTAAFPAWHMNKQHWLGVKLQGDMPDAVLRALLSDAHDMVADALPCKEREALGLIQ